MDNSTPKPDTNKNYIRLYGHPLCPFVERVALLLAAKNIEFQFCGIDLTKRNKWHFLASDGQVPALELQDGRFLYDSDIICDYLQET